MAQLAVSRPISYGDYLLHSAFQPVISVAQSRSVGFEALLRGVDSHGTLVGPLRMFSEAANRFESAELDRLAHNAHLANFLTLGDRASSLFLNCCPDSLLIGPGGRSMLETTVAQLGVAPQRIVIEVLEHAALSIEAVTNAIADHQAKGFLVAIDDFGIGASNFDRVWGVRPDIVKLDRTLVHRASLSRPDRRVAKMLVEMLHRMGSTVVAEGVETLDEALAAMDADVDFMQGYFFARPDANAAITEGPSVERMNSLWPVWARVSEQVDDQESRYISAIREGLGKAVNAIVAGQDAAAAGEVFLQAPYAVSCFLLDGDGVQVSTSVYAKDHLPSPPLNVRLGAVGQGSRWSRRPYFIDAMRTPGIMALHGPHASMGHSGMVFTAALAFERHGAPAVLCGNFWLPNEEIATQARGESEIPLLGPLSPTTLSAELRR